MQITMSSQISKITADYLAKIMQFVNEHGEVDACLEFKINIETLHRYQRLVRFNETKNPKILLLDIETANMVVRCWRLGKQYINMDQIIEDWYMLGWSARWLLTDNTMSDFLTPKESIKRDDTRIVKSIWKLINDCDIVIGHNLKRFDIPHLNTKFLLAKLPPPMPYVMIDTLQVVYKNFSFSSCKLDYLGKLTASKQKLHTEYELWIKCENGDQEALTYMENYCRGDIDVLESVYMALRPWIKSHPNLPLLMDTEEPACVNCGGFEFEDEEGIYLTGQNIYPAVRCKSCGAVNHKRKTFIKPKQRKALFIPNAR
jgi:DNA polymerase elongation subunit (family B)